MASRGQPLHTQLMRAELFTCDTAHTDPHTQERALYELAVLVSQPVCALDCARSACRYTSRLMQGFLYSVNCLVPTSTSRKNILPSNHHYHCHQRVHPYTCRLCVVDLLSITQCFILHQLTLFQQGNNSVASPTKPMMQV